jgi:hypothetical protein
MAVTTNYGAAPTYVKLASQTLASAAASVTFSNIPQGYTDLVIEVVIGNSANGTRDLQWKLNGDSGSNYSSTSMESEGSAAYSGRDTNFTYLRSNGSSNNTPSTYTRINFMNYSNATTFKSMFARSNAVSWYVITKALLWRNTSPITSIVFTSESSSNFVTGSTFNMYGIKAAIRPKAEGGIITHDGSYWYHAFRTTGAFITRQSLTADVLVVAGGGGGGSQLAGGGGAGGVSYLSGTSLTSATSYSVSVGAGGAAGVSSVSTGSNGTNSSFSNIISNGGGAGGSDLSGARAGIAGGSGGGASRDGASGAANQGSTGGATGYGFAGAAGINTDPYGGGGGGGAGAAGSIVTNGGTYGAAAAGGAGLNTWSTWHTATSTGVGGYIAGGGGAGIYSAGGFQTSGPGGSGGGGTGAGTSGGFQIQRPTDGVTNTGSGGGGAGNPSASGTVAGSGGSGLVIVRYSI